MTIPDATALHLVDAPLANIRAELRALANQLRADSIRTSTKAGSGHPTSAMSSADLLAVLMTRHYQYDWHNPALQWNDRLVLSKGHVSSLWYAVLKAAGVIDDTELMTYRQHGSRLQGHPTPVLPWVEIATGSLGQGLPAAVGMAYAAARLRHVPFHTWVICGDGELAEGSMWEAFDKAAVYQLGNLTAIIDANEYGQSSALPYADGPSVHTARIRAFGWHVIEIDGHDVAAIDAALRTARQATDRPTGILARTVKGMGFPPVQHRADMHGVALTDDQARQAIAMLAPPTPVHFTSPAPAQGPENPLRIRRHHPDPPYAIGESVAVRSAFGDAMVACGDSDDVVVIDGDVNKSMYTDRFAASYPERFVQTFISEQQMLGTAVGLSSRGFRPVVSTYAAFLTRAFDFMRMAVVSESEILVAGSHAGVEIGRDGPSQMALEDLAMMRSLHGSTVLYPADGNAAWRLTEAALNVPGVSYVRITRNPYPVVYSATETFPVGGSKTVRSSDADDVVIVAAGATLHEALLAADALAEEGISVRVVDLYSVKPVDADGLTSHLHAVNGKVVVVEDHRPEGGLASAMLEAMRGRPVSIDMRHLAVTNLPASASRDEQYATAGISKRHIIEAVHDLVQPKGTSS
ncbi:MAG: transketolase [Dermatophilaceae bacterium]